MRHPSWRLLTVVQWNSKLTAFVRLGLLGAFSALAGFTSSGVTNFSW